MILQASSGGAWRSLAALIILPFFSASSRKGMKPFMQACEVPPPPPIWVGGAGCAKEPPPPIIGAAPPEGNGDAGALPTDAMGLAPLTGGNAGSFAGAAACPGSGAGNPPCASAEPAVAESTASVSGTIKRLIIKAVSPARSNGPRVSCTKRFYDSCRPLTTRRIWQQRGAAPHFGQYL